MLPADVEQFSDLVAPLTVGRGMWRPYGSLDYHPRLADALAACGDSQAFLHPIGPDDVPVGPMIQFVFGQVGIVHLDRTILPDGRHVPVDINRETLYSGRLAFQWFPGEETPLIQEAFVELAKRAWKGLNSATFPHLVRVYDGKPVRNPRIGPAAEKWALEDDERGLFDPGRWYRVKR